MIIKNKIAKPFGPAGTTAGITTFIIGIVYIFYSLTGIIIIVAGAFIGFTYEKTFLDLDMRKIKFSTLLFGIFPTGKWINIKDDMSLGIENSQRGFRTYSRGMRTNEVVVKDVRIIIYGSDGKKIGPVNKFKTRKSASEELEKLKETLKLEIRS